MNVWEIIKIFLNSNFFVAFTTIIVGGFAIYLYLRRRKDAKRDAASLILQEIRYAEQQIRNSDRSDRGYKLSSRLLPTNSWNDNTHLFIKDLKETEIDMISNFYAEAAYIDFLIAERSRQKINQTFSVENIANQSTASQRSKDIKSKFIAQELNQDLLNRQKISQFVKIPNLNEQITVGLLTKISSKIDYLYNTPAAEKLRKISEKKWHHLI